MTDDQFNKMMAYLEIIAQNTAVIAAQGHLLRPLTGPEHAHCVAEVRRVAEMLQSGLEVGMLPPGGVN